MKNMLLIAAVALSVTGAAAQPVTRTVSTDGRHHDVTRTTVRDPAAGTFLRETSVVRARDGATAHSEIRRARTATGSTTTGTITGFRGKTYALSGNAVRTENGFTANTNIMNEKGRTIYNRDVRVSRSGGQVTRSVEVTRDQRRGLSRLHRR